MRMYKAIKHAAGKSSMTYGLRAIRTFERVNGIPFDPKDRYHLNLIEGCGEHEQFFRKMRLIFKERDNA